MTLDEIRARITEIENILFARSEYQSTVCSPNMAAQLANENRRLALSEELTGLRAQLPKFGEASGQCLVWARTLGTVILRETPLDEPAPDYDRSDPFERFAHEG